MAIISQHKWNGLKTKNKTQLDYKNKTTEKVILSQV